MNAVRLVAAIAITLAALFAATPAQAEPAVCQTDAQCQAYDAARGITSDGGPATTPLVTIPADELSGTSDAFLDALIANGYTGVPGDGMEAIVVPQEAALELCMSDLDCAYASGALVVVGPLQHG